MTTLKLNRKGITLVELLLALGILVIITAAAYGVLTTGVKTYNANIKLSTSQSALRIAMMHISRQERKATTVTVGASTLTLAIGGVNHSYSVSGNQLLYDSTAIATDIKAISSSISGKVVTVTLTATDGTTLSTQMHTN